MNIEFKIFFPETLELLTWEENLESQLHASIFGLRNFPIPGICHGGVDLWSICASLSLSCREGDLPSDPERSPSPWAAPLDCCHNCHSFGGFAAKTCSHREKGVGLNEGNGGNFLEDAVGRFFLGDDMMDKQDRGVCKVEILMEKISRHRL